MLFTKKYTEQVLIKYRTYDFVRIMPLELKGKKA